MSSPISENKVDKNRKRFISIAKSATAVGVVFSIAKSIKNKEKHEITKSIKGDKLKKFKFWKKKHQ